MPTVRQSAHFAKWIGAVHDRQARARIAVRIERLSEGNPGQHRALTGGVVEMKVDVGPGYRVYYTQRGSELILLLIGGDKSTQQRDIEQALQLARSYEMALQTTPWDVQGFLETPEDCAAYVQAAIDEAGDDPAFIVKALGQVARSRGMAAIARDAGISREGLYKAIGDSGNPSFATVFRLLRALGLEVKLQAAAA